MKNSGSRPFEADGMYREKYDRALWDKKSGYLAKKIVDELHPDTVLDIGCAMGFLVEDLKALGVAAIGCDINKYAIENAPEKVKPFLFEQDICASGINDLRWIGIASGLGTFDVIVCSALQYIDECQVDAALETIRVLTGKWFINFAYYKGNLPMESDVWRKIDWTEQEWVAWIEKHGFKYKGDYLYEKIRD